MNTNEEKLRQEILGDAERRAERTLARAQRDAEKALEQVRTEHAALAAQRLADADAEAEGRYQAICASIDHELRNSWLQHRETVIREVLDQALERAENQDDMARRESLRQLLTEALKAIGETDITVRANADWARLLDQEMVETAATDAWTQRGQVAIHIVVDPALRAGIAAESADGRLLFDNTYATRLTRLRPELRALIDTTVERQEGDTVAHE